MRFFARLGLIIVSLALLAACATPSRDPEAVSLLLAEMNQSTPVQLADSSFTPFLFDGEILMRRSQVQDLWESLADTDARFGAAAGPPIRLDQDGAPMVAATQDVRRFYERMPSDATLVFVESSVGPLWIILSGNEDGIPMIRGLGRDSE